MLHMGKIIQPLIVYWIGRTPQSFVYMQKVCFSDFFYCNPRDSHLHNTMLHISVTTAKCISTESQSG